MFVILKARQYVEQTVIMIEAREERVRIEFMKGAKRGQRIIVNASDIERAFA